MADHLADKEWVAAFEKPKGNPAAFKKPDTTCLSPYLKFGCVSSRLFYSQLAAVSHMSFHAVDPLSGSSDITFALLRAK